MDGRLHKRDFMEEMLRSLALIIHPKPSILFFVVIRLVRFHYVGTVESMVKSPGLIKKGESIKLQNSSV